MSEVCTSVSQERLVFTSQGLERALRILNGYPDSCNAILVNPNRSAVEGVIADEYRRRNRRPTRGEVRGFIKQVFNALQTSNA